MYKPKHKQSILIIILICMLIGGTYVYHRLIQHEFAEAYQKYAGETENWYCEVVTWKTNDRDIPFEYSCDIEYKKEVIEPYNEITVQLGPKGEAKTDAFGALNTLGSTKKQHSFKNGSNAPVVKKGQILEVSVLLDNKEAELIQMYPSID